MSVSILDLLRADGSIVVNKKLAHQIGLDSAVIYSELVSLFIYWRDRGKLVNESLEENKPDVKWFYCTMENLEQNTTLKRKPQDKAIKNLLNLGLIEVKQMGLPKKRYFTITDGILKLLGLQEDGTHKSDQKGHSDNIKDSEAENEEKSRHCQSDQKGHSVLSKKDTLQRPKGTTNNTINNNTENNPLEKREREIKDYILHSEIESDLKGFLTDKEQIDLLVKNRIDIEKTLRWIKANQEVYTFSEMVVGLLQMIEYPEKIENPIKFLNATFSNIDGYVKQATAKNKKRLEKLLTEREQERQGSSQAHQVQEFPFYNWLEEDQDEA